MDKFILDEFSQDIYPGFGANEFLQHSDAKATRDVFSFIAAMEQYRELAAVSNWRFLLSDYGDSPITIDNIKWSSVSHYVNAMRFVNNPEVYSIFCTNSFTTPNGLIARAKSRRYTPDPRSYVTTLDYTDRAQKVKFEQNPHLLKILKQTHNAELYTHERGVGIRRCDLLERIRDTPA